MGWIVSASVVGVDADDVAFGIKSHDFGGVETGDAAVGEGDAGDAGKDAQLAEVQIRVFLQGLGEVGAEADFAAKDAGGFAGDLDDEGGAEDDRVVIVGEDCVEVMPVPRVDPVPAERPRLFFRDHGNPKKIDPHYIDVC